MSITILNGSVYTKISIKPHVLEYFLATPHSM